MRWMMCVVLSVVALPALAQDVGQSGFMVRDVESVRFAGERTPGPKFEASKRVMVVDRTGDQVRVAMGDRFGWVPADAVQSQPPGIPAETPTVELKPVQE